MKYYGQFGEVTYVIKKRGPMEYVPVVAGASLAPGGTLNEAVEIAVDAIKNGARTEFKSTISWPEAPSTSRNVSFKRYNSCESFCDLMFNTLGRGGTISIGPRGD